MNGIGDVLRQCGEAGAGPHGADAAARRLPLSGRTTAPGPCPRTGMGRRVGSGWGTRVGIRPGTGMGTGLGNGRGTAPGRGWHRSRTVRARRGPGPRAGWAKGAAENAATATARGVSFAAPAADHRNGARGGQDLAGQKTVPTSLPFDTGQIKKNGHSESQKVRKSARNFVDLHQFSTGNPVALTLTRLLATVGP